jgi:large subunit ribosomal protein L9
MAKRMQVILNQKVSKLGENGDVVEVAPGYGAQLPYPQGAGRFSHQGCD